MLGSGDPIGLKKREWLLLLSDQKREGGESGHPARILRQIGVGANGDETAVGPDHDLRAKLLQRTCQCGDLLGRVGAKREGELLGKGFGFHIGRQGGRRHNRIITGDQGASIP
jgi:hypothetical protein